MKRNGDNPSRAAYPPAGLRSIEETDPPCPAFQRERLPNHGRDPRRGVKVSFWKRGIQGDFPVRLSGAHLRFDR
jgi:hypothetical protein